MHNTFGENGKISRREAIRRGLIATPGMMLAARLGMAGSRSGTGINPVGVENSEVRMHNGAPTLFVNGKPNTGFTFFFCGMKNAVEDIPDFSKAGIDLFSGCGIYTLKPDGTPDYDAYGKALESVIRSNPDVLILPRTGVHYIGTDHPWYDRYRDEMQININPENGKRQIAGAFSMSSRFWLEEVVPLLGDIVRFTEEHFGEHILGYHIHGGATGEWAYHWSRDMLSDYSAPQQAAFQSWLQRKYGNNSALRQAWKQEETTFETAAIPTDRTRADWQDVFFDPVKDRPAIDYMHFHSEAMANALLKCVGIVKNALKQLGRSKICGAYYGYHFKRFNSPSNLFNQGHYAGDEVFHSPDIDFVCAPYNYSGRESGHMYHAQSATGSHRVHGKLYWCEEDTATYLVPEGRPHFHRNPDRFTSIETLKRNTMGVLRDGGTLWYMDLYQQGAFRDGDIMQTISRLQTLAEDRLQHASLATTAQVAVFVSGASKSYIRQDTSLIDPLIARQLYELGAMGCSFDSYRVEDLPQLVRQPWLEQYRMMVFLDAVYIDDPNRHLIETVLKKDNRTLVWMYASGILTDNGVSVEAMENLTGFRLALQNRNMPPMANTVLTGTKIWYGASQPVKPLIYGMDTDAVTTGWYLDTGLPALMLRNRGNWRSVWSGAPALPAAVLRHLAREADVHLYLDTGDQVIAEKGYVTVHAGFDGGREIRLPKAQKVADAMTGEVVAAHTDRIKTEMKKGQTGIWRLSAAD